MLLSFLCFLVDCLQSDESYILPVLLRFDGQPELDDEVYTNFLSWCSLYDTNVTCPAASSLVNFIKKNIFVLFREIFCIAFHPCNAQLLDLAGERNTWGNGLTLLQTWRSSSRRKNGNLGSYHCFAPEKCLLLSVVQLVIVESCFFP